MKNPNSKQMSQVQNEAFQFDFVKCLVQIVRQSVAMTIDLSFYFIRKLLHILKSFILSNSILITCSQVNHTHTQAFDTLNFPTLAAITILILLLASSKSNMRTKTLPYCECLFRQNLYSCLKMKIKL